MQREIALHALQRRPALGITESPILDGQLKVHRIAGAIAIFTIVVIPHLGEMQAALGDLPRDIACQPLAQRRVQHLHRQPGGQRYAAGVHVAHLEIQLEAIMVLCGNLQAEAPRHIGASALDMQVMPRDAAATVIDLDLDHTVGGLELPAVAEDLGEVKAHAWVTAKRDPARDAAFIKTLRGDPGRQRPEPRGALPGFHLGAGETQRQLHGQRGIEAYPGQRQGKAGGRATRIERLEHIAQLAERQHVAPARHLLQIETAGDQRHAALGEIPRQRNTLGQTGKRRGDFWR